MNPLRANADTMAFARVAIACDIIKDTRVPDSLGQVKSRVISAVMELEDALRTIATGGNE